MLSAQEKQWLGGYRNFASPPRETEVDEHMLCP